MKIVGILVKIVEMQRLKKYIFLFCVYKMVVITVQNYTDAKVHTITVGNRELFWVKMIDVQKGLGMKNISDLVRKGIQGIYGTKDFTKKQKRKCIRTKQEISKKPTDDSKIKYVRGDLMEKNNKKL